MAFSPVNLVGGAYRDTSLPFSCQDTVNFIPEVSMTQGSRTVSKLRGAPGMELFKTLGKGPVRGMRNVEGRLFVVSGRTLYEVSANGDVKDRGVIPGVGFVVMAHNQIAMGNELLISNGSTGFVWNTRTEKLTRITDEGYPGAIAVDYINSYLMQVEPFGRFWFHSDLADASSYNTLDQGQSEYAPDKIVTLVVNNNEVIVFSEQSIEFFVNTGNATGTFQSKGIGVDVGCAGRHTVSKLDNTVFFLDNYGRVRRFNGYNPAIISTPALEAEFNDRKMSQAFSFTYESEGHCIYYLTFPDGMTFGYDVTSGEWHRRQSFGLQRWRLNELVYWQGRWIGGDFANGNLYRVDWSIHQENGQPLIAERISPVMHNNQARASAKYAEVIMDTGHGRALENKQLAEDNILSDYKLLLDYSDDGGRNWSNRREKSLGKVGDYRKRLTFFGLGSFRNRVYRLSVSSNCKRDILGAVVELEGSDR